MQLHAYASGGELQLQTAHLIDASLLYCAHLAAVAKWFQRKVQKTLSPTHFTVEPSCSVLNASTLADSAPYDDAGHIGTVSVIGELHLRPGGLNHTLLEEGMVLPWGKDVADLTKDTDYILTNFPTIIRRSDSPKQLLK